MRQLENSNTLLKKIAAKFSEIDDLLRDTFINRHTHSIELSIPSRDTVRIGLRLILEFIELVDPDFKKHLKNTNELQRVLNHWNFFDEIQKNGDLIKSVKTPQ